jgi:DNA-binding MarR family transcriptional regulator
MDHNQKTKQQIFDLFIKFTHQKEQFENRKGDVFLEKLRTTMTLESPLNMTEIHVISCIGQNEPINLTTIADSLEISKGNISKVCTKLLQHNWVRKTQLSDNKKEIFFRLTPAGKKLFDLHEELHMKAEMQFLGFLDSYQEKELEFAKRFLRDLTDYYGNSEAKL